MSGLSGRSASPRQAPRWVEQPEGSGPVQQKIQQHSLTAASTSYRPRPALAGTADKRPAAPLVRDEEARARCVPDRPVKPGQSRSLGDTRPYRLTCARAGQRRRTGSLPSWLCGFDSRRPLSCFRRSAASPLPCCPTGTGVWTRARATYVPPRRGRRCRGPGPNARSGRGDRRRHRRGR